MNVTPKTVASQVRIARVQRDALAFKRSQGSRLAYSTSTGEAPRVAPEDVQQIDAEPFCFICSRATDHFAEHDDAVESGEWVYREDGSVVPAGGWKIAR